MKNSSSEYGTAGTESGLNYSNQMGGGNSLAQQLDMIMNSGNLANLSNNISALGLSLTGTTAGLSSIGLGDPLQENSLDTASITAQKQLQDLTNAYKTQLCKHFDQTGHCAKGNSCHFAHGYAEKRHRTDPLPTELVLKMMNVQYNNYKTQLCKFWVQEGKCRFNKNCSYAHGEQELRKPYDELPKDANPIVVNRNQINPIDDHYKSPLKRNDHTGYGPHKLKIIMNTNDDHACQKILQANRYLQTGQQEKGYDIIQDLLNLELISFEYEQVDSQMTGSTFQNTQNTQGYSGNHTTPNYTQSQGYYEGGLESSIEQNIVDSLDLDDVSGCSSSIFSSNIYVNQ